MPPKKNKQQHNAFYYFMIDFRDKQGKKMGSLKDVADAAGPHWAQMSREQRRPYEERARKDKSARLTSEGHNVDVLLAVQKQQEMRTHEMREEINNIISIACQMGGIAAHQFFIVHVNLFLPNPIREKYYPAEIAVSAFTLQDGLQDVFHKLLFPGSLPLGYASEAKIHSQNSHQLFNTCDEISKYNLQEAYQEIKAFLSEKCNVAGYIPTLYADENYIEMISDVLNGWCLDAGDDPQFNIYSLPYMLRVLKNTVSGGNAWYSDTQSAREVEKDAFCFTIGICCQFHDVTDAIQYCSRSYVVRYVYVVCDICCADLKIPLVPGCHIPDRTIKSSSSVRSSSSLSSCRSSSRSSLSSSTSRTTYESKEDDVASVASYSSKSDWDNQSTSTLCDEDDDFSYPSLNYLRRHRGGAGDDGTSSHTTTRGYAHMVRSSGSTAEKPSMTYGSGDHSSSDSTVVSDSQSSSRDFPPLGRGRGLSRGRGMGGRGGVRGKRL